MKRCYSEVLHPVYWVVKIMYTKQSHIFTYAKPNDSFFLQKYTTSISIFKHLINRSLKLSSVHVLMLQCNNRKHLPNDHACELGETQVRIKDLLMFYTKYTVWKKWCHPLTLPILLCYFICDYTHTVGIKCHVMFVCC